MIVHNMRFLLFERFALNSAYGKSSPTTSIDRGGFVSATWGRQIRGRCNFVEPGLPPIADMGRDSGASRSHSGYDAAAGRVHLGEIKEGIQGMM